MLRIIIEIDGREVATTTITPESAQAAIALRQTMEPPGTMEPTELLARAPAIGAASAGPAPAAVTAPVASMAAVAPTSPAATWPYAVAGVRGGIDAGAAPDFKPQPGESASGKA